MDMLESGRVAVDAPSLLDVGTFVAAVVASIGVLGALAVAWRQLDLNRRTGQGHLLLQLTARWDSPPVLDSRRKIASYPDGEALRERIQEVHASQEPKDITEYSLLIAVADFLEDLGVLVRQKSLSEDMARDWLGPNITDFWRSYEPWITEYRTKFGKEIYWEAFQELATKMA